MSKQNSIKDFNLQSPYPGRYFSSLNQHEIKELMFNNQLEDIYYSLSDFNLDGLDLSLLKYEDLISELKIKNLQQRNRLMKFINKELSSQLKLNLYYDSKPFVIQVNNENDLDVECLMKFIKDAKNFCNQNISLITKENIILGPKAKIRDLLIFYPEKYTDLYIVHNFETKKFFENNHKDNFQSPNKTNFKNDINFNSDKLHHFQLEKKDASYIETMNRYNGNLKSKKMDISNNEDQRPVSSLSDNSTALHLNKNEIDRFTNYDNSQRNYSKKGRRNFLYDSKGDDDLIESPQFVNNDIGSLQQNNNSQNQSFYNFESKYSNRAGGFETKIIVDDNTRKYNDYRNNDNVNEHSRLRDKQDYSDISRENNTFNYKQDYLNQNANLFHENELNRKNYYNNEKAYNSQDEVNRLDFSDKSQNYLDNKPNNLNDLENYELKQNDNNNDSNFISSENHHNNPIKNSSETDNLKFSNELRKERFGSNQKFNKYDYLSKENLSHNAYSDNQNLYDEKNDIGIKYKSFSNQNINLDRKYNYQSYIKSEEYKKYNRENNLKNEDNSYKISKIESSIGSNSIDNKGKMQIDNLNRDYKGVEIQREVNKYDLDRKNEDKNLVSKKFASERRSFRDEHNSNLTIGRNPNNASAKYDNILNKFEYNPDSASEKNPCSKDKSSSIRAGNSNSTNTTSLYSGNFAKGTHIENDKFFKNFDSFNKKISSIKTQFGNNFGLKEKEQKDSNM